MMYKRFALSNKNDLKIGDIAAGIVKNIRPYGAFIELENGLIGLLKIEDISIARIKTPEERLKIGQKVNVVVKSIDKEKSRVFFSYKEFLGTWEENIKGINKGEIIKGKIRETEKYKNGIFIELKPNLVGMAEYIPNMEYGREVNVYVKKIIPEKKKIKLKIV